MAESSSYLRTWRHDRSEASHRWAILIDGKEVPGGFVVRTDEGAYEAHYPHFEQVLTYQTLDEAQAALECAPVVLAGSMKVGKPASEGEALIGSEEAGRLLGISQYRINAMVVNGVLAGARVNGKTMVSSEAVERLLEEQSKKQSVSASNENGETSVASAEHVGPQGIFANTFLEYRSHDDALYAIVSLDCGNEEAIADGKLFVDWVNEAPMERGNAALMDYRGMRALYARLAKAGEALPEKMTFDALVTAASPSHEE